MMAAITISQEERLQAQIKKLRQLNWNVDIVYWAAFEFDFKVRQHNETYFSVSFSKKKRLDYWTDISRGQWFYKNHADGRPFDIPDIEAYLIEYFNPKKEL